MFTLRTSHELGARGRGRTGTALGRRDFKSRVSTNFTTRAEKRRPVVYRVTDSCSIYRATLSPIEVLVSN